MQTILGDNKCQELWHLLKRIRRKEGVTLHDIVRYRREAERHVGSDEHLYKIDCVSYELCAAVPRFELTGHAGRAHEEHADPVAGDERSEHRRR